MTQPVSIVIVTHNNFDVLIQCLDGLKEVLCPVVIVDNASEKVETLESCINLWRGHEGVNAASVQGVNASSVTLIKNAENMGFSYACNQGARAVDSEYILFLNPDCFPSPSQLHEVREYLDANPRAGMAGVRLVNRDGTEQRGCRRKVPTLWSAFVRAFWLDRLFKDFSQHNDTLPSEPVEIEATSGAFIFIRRSVFEAIGGWDEGYFLHCEDMDLCVRVRQAGSKIMFLPHIQVTHLKGESSKRYPLFVAWSMHKGMIRFNHKFNGNFYTKPLLWIIDCAVVARFCLLVCGYVARKLYDQKFEGSLKLPRYRSHI